MGRSQGGRQLRTSRAAKGSLDWTNGGSARVSRAGSGGAPEPWVEPFSLGNGFWRDAENGNREVASKLKGPNVEDESFEEVVKSAQEAAVLVLVY